MFGEWLDKKRAKSADMAENKIGEIPVAGPGTLPPHGPNFREDPMATCPTTTARTMEFGATTELHFLQAVLLLPPPVPNLINLYAPLQLGPNLTRYIYI